MKFKNSNHTIGLSNQLVESAASFALDVLGAQLSPKLLFHNQRYTAQTVHACNLIARAEELPHLDRTELLVAAWFHHTGFTQTRTNHREVSATIATDFLSQYDLEPESRDRITACILQSASPWDVSAPIDMILYDADWYFLAASNFKEMLDRKKEELIQLDGTLEVLQWMDYLDDCFVRHQYLTNYGQEHLHNLRRVNYTNLKSQHGKWWSDNRSVYEPRSSRGIFY